MTEDETSPFLVKVFQDIKISKLRLKQNKRPHNIKLI